ncbi:hypothetical protein [Actinocrinis sp.]|uniref:hypothetical protein n=1 Tax=Actinocrinis sp. TaxID=1920516 RepID=UPI002D51582A|nr:hypothetical protein [Actinocrinis sp.]HZP54045.1 hypothetical protein [Actinocrinis sp.]
MSETSFSTNDQGADGPPPPPPGGPPTAKAFKSSLAARLEKDPEAKRIIDDYDVRLRLRDTHWSKKLDGRIREMIALFTQIDRHLSSVSRMLQETQGDRVARLMADLKPLATLAVPVKTAGIFYRADGRSPWTMQKHGGFEHLEGGDIGLVRSGLKALALKFDSVSDWIAVYRITKNSHGLPTISTGPNPGDAQGASNGRWQYGIKLPSTMKEYPITEKTLGVDFRKKSDRGDRLWMNAPTVDEATEIAIVGGDLPECTFLTKIKLEYIVSYVLLTDGPNYLTGVWRPFVADDVAAYRNVLQTYGELDFPE